MTSVSLRMLENSRESLAESLYLVLPVLRGHSRHLPQLHPVHGVQNRGELSRKKQVLGRGEN